MFPTVSGKSIAPLVCLATFRLQLDTVGFVIALLVLAGSALIVAALYFARAILLPIALAESGDRPPDSRAQRSDRALHDLVACAVVFFQP